MVWRRKATALVLALRGDAVDTLYTISESEQKSYSTLFEMRYSDYDLQQVSHAQLEFKE